MKQLLSATLWASAAALALGTPAWAQDQIRYLDRKTMKEATATGTVQEETPALVVYKLGTSATTKEIPAVDISDISYEVPGGARLTYRSAQAEERRAADPSARDADRRKAISEALRNYEEVLPRLQGDKLKFAERNVQYRIARLRARQAEDDPEQLDAAIEALTRFKQQHSQGWQIISCAKLLARLQLTKGDTDAALKTYAELAANANLPIAVRQECDLLEAEALIRGKKYPDAQRKLETVLKSVRADDPQAVRIRIYLAQCQGAAGKLPEAVTQLEGIIAKTPEKDLKALAYNALGDCYRLNGKNKEALWPYLWVDVIYHQDKQEHIRAMEQLAKLFDEQGDKARARQYRERVKKEAR
jgi:lipopolysaccharide biosynthesis regulator YciM